MALVRERVRKPLSDRPVYPGPINHQRHRHCFEHYCPDKIDRNESITPFIVFNFDCSVAHPSDQ